MKATIRLGLTHFLIERFIDTWFSYQVNVKKIRVKTVASYFLLPNTLYSDIKYELRHYFNKKKWASAIYSFLRGKK